MLYMLLICSDLTKPPDPNDRNRIPEHAALEQEMRNDGKYAGGAGLFPVDAATMVRQEGDDVVVIDGPFAETKEAIGGFFVIDCEDKEEAIAYAKRISVDNRSWVEARPIALWHPK